MTSPWSSIRVMPAPASLLLIAAALAAGCATSSVYRPVSGSDQPPSNQTTTPAPPTEVAPAVGIGADRHESEPQQDVPVVPSTPTASQPSDGATATLALLQQSDRALATGNTDEALAYLERAIRLDPLRADLWLHLAELHLVRGEPEAAVQFANKSISLAGDRSDWVRDAWLIIANARAAQGDTEAAEDIRARWRTYRG